MSDEATAKADKATAEARTAEAAADKAEREGREADSPLGRSKREAETQKAISEAHQGAAEAQQKQISALLPDLSKVPSGSLETKGEGALFGTALAEQAVAAAAELVAEFAAKAIEGEEHPRILVTSDADLASSDAIYAEVVAGLDQLTGAARSLAEQVDPPVDAPPAGTAMGILPLAPIIGAIAAAIPGALSLISAHRTLSTTPVTVDNLAAAAAVLGSLVEYAPDAHVFHDDIRVLPSEGVVQRKMSTLADLRQGLVGKKIALEDEKATKDAELTKLIAEAKDSDDQLGKAKDEERSEIETKLGQQRGEVEACEVQTSLRAARIGLIDSTLAAIDKFTGSLQTTVEGAKHSPLTAAILREQLHGNGAKKFTHVLMVKAQPGSAQQLVDVHAVRDDRFSTIATSSVAYVLIETGEGEVVRAGSVGGEAKISGSIGGDFSIEASSISARRE